MEMCPLLNEFIRFSVNVLFDLSETYTFSRAEPRFEQNYMFYLTKSIVFLQVRCFIEVKPILLRSQNLRFHVNCVKNRCKVEHNLLFSFSETHILLESASFA